MNRYTYLGEIEL